MDRKLSCGCVIYLSCCWSRCWPVAKNQNCLRRSTPAISAQRLTDHNGKTRTLADFRGKAVVLFFGYTQCPDVCVTTLADLAQMMQLLGSDADKVQVLFITVDPERDKPEMLMQYVPAFHPSFLGLYGDAQATAQAAKAFYVAYEKRPTASGYNMDHTVGAFLVDPNGKVRLRAPLAQRTDWLVDDIRLLLGGA
ncbi:MAG: SCO family protein [Nitrosomonadales bacterium]|nr:SCO family protein [Nitrosomonadales bacterium]